ncbi:hypothetical protein SAMN05216276_1012140 [Streptosporangium subroseum]|uniref:Uncharacterized protein n=1 Tax=Streptosporangium subroseum TaxID=106412 RepID=A0A239FZK6_9ACTN|nr:hypothetical protein [Streptosporangium subroseum]SNS61722.1 hypothetical protein SAMN05216276_1012140 [Streptosporangium subroseum]
MVAEVLEERHHGHHVGLLQAKHEPIDWRPSLSRAGPARVKEHTCDCRATFYELCQAGGLMFIRRTHRLRGAVDVHESPWVVARDTQALWLRLLMGSAR